MLIRTFKQTDPLAARERLSALRGRLTSMRKALTWSVMAYSQYPFQRARFRAIAHPFKVIYIDPDCVNTQLQQERKKRKLFPWGAIKDGNWDKEVNFRYGDDDIAYRSLCQHFRDGLAWEDTLLFSHYAQLLTTRSSTKAGCQSVSELKTYYESHIHRLYYELKNNGLRSPTDFEIDPIYVYIGRYGDLIYAGNGNHRLLIAKLLGIRKFPVLVRMRHLHWQMVRETVKSTLSTNDRLLEYQGHPDLQDLVYPYLAEKGDGVVHKS